MTSTNVIHLPQQLRSVAMRGGLIFLEVILVPALLLALLGSAGQVTLGIVAVFVWRALVAGLRLGLVGMLPATTILTFALLSARTGAGTVFGLTDAGSPLVAYVLPGCAVSLLAAMYFMRNANTERPILLKIVKDFVALNEDAEARLLPIFQRLTFIVGALQAFFAILGASVVLTMAEETASVFTAVLCLLTPVAFVTACVLMGYFMLKRLDVSLSFKLPTLN